jgi:SAM-dependent methyltransferase
MKLKQLIPQPVKSGVRRVIDNVEYSVTSTLKIRDPLVPPPGLHGVGGYFQSAGREFMPYFIEHGGMKPTDRVLDIGAGTGRMAIRIKDYLTTGTYDGTEIVKSSVEWCRQAYSAYPNFNFHHSDVFNEFYNPGGTTKAADYTFPFPDESFDFAFLTSVFTHMFPSDVKNYLSEVARMLSSGGRLLATVFLLDEDTRQLMARGQSQFDFRFELDGCWTAFNDRPPESAIAFEEADFVKMAEDAGLVVISKHRGTWRGTPGLSTQDIYILGRAPAC